MDEKNQKGASSEQVWETTVLPALDSAAPPPVDLRRRTLAWLDDLRPEDRGRCGEGVAEWLERRENRSASLSHALREGYATEVAMQRASPGSDARRPELGQGRALGG